MRMATSSSPRRGRQSGVDLKPPQAAVVKSDGGERCGKAGTRFRQARLREANVSEPSIKCRNRRRHLEWRCTMKTLHRRCAGLDVHNDSVVACARLTVRSKTSYEVCRLSTATRDLLQLADWLEARGITHVAMEATGVYWKPIWHILEGRFELVLANAAHIRNVPGRKSDVNDAVWISDLLAHGLIRA